MAFKAVLNKMKPSDTNSDFSPVYSRLSNESIRTSLPQEQSQIDNDNSYTVRPKRISWLTMGNITLFVVSTALLALAYSRPISDASCTRQLFSYSPALEAVEYHEEDYKGVFHQASIYRGTPTDEIDENWRELWDCALTTASHYAALVQDLEAAGYPTISLDPPSITYPDATTVIADTDIAFVRAFVLVPLLAEGKDVGLLCHSYGGTHGAGAVQGLSKEDSAVRGQQGGIVGIVYIASFPRPEILLCKR
ncbi:uncharacterized protein N0V89_001013 [Didymosphaeria variabile]|uniref:AB hydrolase-1 domain-containing protein n=1 Tax=Didymosphaeria variabile TaxID=1932322 RepID=A0A9W8XXM2_9PLEO|nr:uncharacterized protein N0V89_001013 [Didymosphaeria variabile]KAJ4360450.1 hypothetical protein N0V89_001013 [Didymosphaeria variabile]